MCGIGGICSYGDKISENALSRMSRALAHRGPDGKGDWVSKCGRIGLVHRRLAILDPGPLGRQPMVSDCGRWILIFNGEIYNFRKLKQQLEDGGEKFKSRSDTEVLLRLWMNEQEECLPRLRGMYAFAVWDAFEHKLTLVRDPLGIKPLYYCKLADSGLAFASEARIINGVFGPFPVSVAAIGALLKWGSIPHPLCLHEEIKALEPGCGLVWHWESGETSRFQHWNLAHLTTDKRQITDWHEAVEVTRECLVESVRDHLVSDVPVGAFLSGGIDSTAVVSLMRQAGQEHIRTFSLASDDAALDESTHARQAAVKYGTEHFEWRIGNSQFESYLPVFLDTMDQPSIDGFNTWLVSRFASQNNMKVVTSGVGGDECFAGYKSTFARFVWWKRWVSGMPRSGRMMIGRTASLLGIMTMLPRSKVERIQALMVAESPEDAYIACRSIFNCNKISELFQDREFGMEAAGFEPAKMLPELDEQVDDLHRISWWEASAYMGSQLLRDSDVFSMAHGLELRTPLVDRRVMETLAMIDPACFYHENIAKPLLVRATGDIPDELVRRRKMTFTLPFAAWMRKTGITGTGGLMESLAGNDWNRILDETVTRKLEADFMQGRLHWSRLWVLGLAARFLAQ